MTTVRRLADADVRSIFESIHDNKPAPHHLKFTIIPVGPTGLKLSPPSFEFEGKLAYSLCWSLLRLLVAVTSNLLTVISFLLYDGIHPFDSFVFRFPQRWPLHLAKATEKEERRYRSFQGSPPFNGSRRAKNAT